MSPACEVHGHPLDDVSDCRDTGPLWLCEDCPSDCICHGAATVAPGCPAHSLLVEPLSDVEVEAAVTAAGRWYTPERAA